MAGAQPAPRRKVPFRVVACSGEDPQHPVSELHTHSAKTRGWQSPAFCTYPQEIGLALEGEDMSLSQLQVLSHQHKIASRLEIFVGTGDDYDTARFKRLGYMSLDNNTRSRYKARELKSVYINTKGRFLKLLFHKCYNNELNSQGQVGIIAVNLLGGNSPPPPSSSSSQATAMPPPQQQQQQQAAQPGRSALRSRQEGAAQPQAGGMGQKKPAAQMDVSKAMAKLQALKMQAVEAENYEEAKRLKQLRDMLESLTQDLGKLQARKDAAVRSEDYSLAKRVKGQIDQVRSSINTMVRDLVGGGGVGGAPAGAGGGDGRGMHGGVGGGRAPGGSDDSRPFQAPGVPPRGQYAHLDPPLPQQENERPTMSPPRPRSGRGEAAALSNRPPNPKGSAKPELDWLKQEYASPDGGGGGGGGGGGPAAGGPAAGDAAQAFPPGEHPLEGVPGVENMASPDPLSSAAAQKAQGIVTVFGDYVARSLFSRAWNLRNAALLKVTRELPRLPPSAPAHAVLQAVQVCLGEAGSDKVGTIYFTGLGLCRAFLSSYARAPSVTARDASGAVGAFAGVLVADKLGDNNGRTRDRTMQALTDMVRHDKLGPRFLAELLLSPMSAKQTRAWRGLVCRCQLLARVVDEFGCCTGRPGPGRDGPQLSADDVLEFMLGARALAHSRAEVRDAAKQCLGRVYECVGDVGVRRHLDRLDKAARQGVDNFLAGLGGGGGGGRTMARAASADPQRGGRRQQDGAAMRTSTAPGGSGGGSLRGTAAAAAAAQPQEEPQDEDDTPPFTCPFCGIHDEKFTKEYLDYHWLVECPMLIACPGGGQIIEVRDLVEHLCVDGCCGKEKRQGEWQSAVASLGAAREDALRVCPLCYETVGPDDEAWQQHLVKECCSNPRNGGKFNGRMPLGLRCDIEAR